MSEFEKANCFLCSSNEYLPYSTKGQFGITSNVVICKNCGFSYLNPRWTKERYHTYYTKEYQTFYEKQYQPFKTIKAIVTRSKDVLDFTSKDINILDVGAGIGDSLIYLKNNINTSASYFAIESSEHCVTN